ncbi:alpha/beta hydrolase [Streptomyces sp. Ag109_O5-10]|uniref:alpha/beta hydrolase n=1 Tax=Streptomyces sp. Ag109_O5-10 TaxID=1855349 RepID=UPI0015A55329|nr:alpha/beta hydrolase [Streptomyces sp. Ag109_O5-10]
MAESDRECPVEGWIWNENVRPFLALLARYADYDFDGTDLQAVVHQTRHLTRTVGRLPSSSTSLRDTFIAVAQLDVFRDENLDFAQRLIAAGVPVDLHVYAHAFHAWDVFAPQSAPAKTFEQTWHDYLCRHLHS